MFRALGRGLFAGGLALLAFGLLSALFPFDAESVRAVPSGLTLTDRGGIPLRVRLAADGSDSAPGYRWREDDWIGKAVVAVEDQRFWDHPGVDALALARSCRQTVSAQRRVSGASTLSMQLIRLSHPRPRTLGSKMIEAFRALQMERELGKREILSLYLDRAPFGSNLVGVEAAARRYFDKSAHDLSLAEASLLAGIPQSPVRFHPLRHAEAARRRQAHVLERMVALGMITPAQRSNALGQELRFQQRRHPFLAPHFCDMLRRPTQDMSGRVATTLDLGLQLALEEAVAKHAPALASQGVRGAAAVALDVKTGAVLALVGSVDFHAPRRGAQVNAALAPRSAGSTLKPFVYALGIERGSHTPLKVLYDVPARFSDYDPLNFDKGHRGLVTLRAALVDSLNLPAVQVEREVGQPRFYEILRGLGLRTLNRPAEHYGLGLVLGNAEVGLLDLTNAYACLARGGLFLPWSLLPGQSAAPRQALSPETCWLITDMLGGDERAMTSTGTVGDIRFARFAWKTGTSSGFRDAWTIACNPELAIGVWLGNPDGRPAPALTGQRLAAPLVWEISRRLYPDGRGPWFDRPATVETREVCALSGQTPGPDCKRTTRDFGIRGVTRYESCQVHAHGPEPVWPPRVAEFLRQRGDAGGAVEGAGLAITSPADGSSYLYVRDSLSPGRQSIPLTATAGSPRARLHWFVNDRYLGESRSGESLFWDLRPGVHRVVCADDSGASRSARIVVTTPRGGVSTNPAPE